MILIDMVLRLFFRSLSLAKQAEFMKRRGIVVGTRNRGGRMRYLYMVNNLFAEIIYENDNPRLQPESVIVMDGLKRLTSYLEKELR